MEEEGPHRPQTVEEVELEVVLGRQVLVVQPEVVGVLAVVLVQLVELEEQEEQEEQVEQVEPVVLVGPEVELELGVAHPLVAEEVQVEVEAQMEQAVELLVLGFAVDFGRFEFVAAAEVLAFDIVRCAILHRCTKALLGHSVGDCSCFPQLPIHHQKKRLHRPEIENSTHKLDAGPSTGEKLVWLCCISNSYQVNN